MVPFCVIQGFPSWATLQARQKESHHLGGGGKTDTYFSVPRSDTIFEGVPFPTSHSQAKIGYVPLQCLCTPIPFLLDSGFTGSEPS